MDLMVRIFHCMVSIRLKLTIKLTKIRMFVIVLSFYGNVLKGILNYER